uniref:Mortality factor 4-like protein 1 n=1 Tax=Amblyomma maculatum TaxID=34609 RepID=G3MP34_AMBMU
MAAHGPRRPRDSDPPVSNMAPKAKFLDGERVLCYHGPLLYEAKCIKAQVKDKQTKYFIHYSGWNKNWDEWVPESRVLKFSDANLQKQKDLERAHLSAASQSHSAVKGKKTKGTKSKKEVDKERSAPSQTQKQKGTAASSSATTQQQGTTSQTTEAAGETQRKKRNRQEPLNAPEGFPAEVTVKVPEELKPWLVDDWHLITWQKKLVQLPCKLTVDQIFADYVQERTSANGISPNKGKSVVIEVTNGLKEYFNLMLGSQLLYNFERPQYDDILNDNPDTPMSGIYGATHLLRLFVKIGGMLSYTKLDEKCIQILQAETREFLTYMAKNSSNLFDPKEYATASSDYQQKAT